MDRKMSECDNLRTPCENKGDYSAFDQICSFELAKAVTVDEIVNQSKFCTSIILDLPEELKSFDLTVHEYLATLAGKQGVYHLWIKDDYCSVHDTYSMICVYVGKGVALGRVKNHIKEKWEKCKDETIYISFYECENRISKYLEQLFLDTYHFELNDHENVGSKFLYGRWDSHRFDNGTETQEEGNRLVEKNREFFEGWAAI
jgi:hypothetical protein